MDQKLLYINIDGFSYSYFERLLQNDPAGSFAQLRQQGMLFSNLRSGLVSITNPMQSAILCGAWSNQTHNFYQHYDWDSGTVVKHLRTCDVENIAHLMAREGKTVVSIHQFMLENNPCREGSKTCAYIKCPQAKSNAFHRLEVLKSLIKGQPVISGEQSFAYEEFPDLVAVYIDDIDSLGHNNAYEYYPKRADFEERQQDIQKRLARIGDDLLEVVRLCEQTGLLNDLTILITTDHGMTPFFGKSRLPDFINRLNQAGIQAALPDDRVDATRAVALPYTIELSLYCAPDITDAEKQVIRQVCRSAPYVSRFFEKEEMQRDFGFDPRGPEFLISPRYGDHFYHRDVANNTFGASHDSFHETSQHIFGLVLGNGILPNSLSEAQTYVIDLLPHIASQKHGLVLNKHRNTMLNW